MEKLLILLVIFAPCWAADLSGQVLVFPRESNSDHVKLKTNKTSIHSVTSCMRFKTDLTRNYGLLSLATLTHKNDFVLFKTEENNSRRQVIRVHARDGGTDFMSLHLPPNDWHYLCVTWDSVTGLSQMWLNGKSTIKRFIKTGQISGAPSVILGQEQDSYGGGFDANQSFLGMVTNFHMWDSVLPAEEIRLYMRGKYFPPGNVFNWADLEYEKVGNVAIENLADVV